jgi:hypothetical protein
VLVLVLVRYLVICLSMETRTKNASESLRMVG